MSIEQSTIQVLQIVPEVNTEKDSQLLEILKKWDLESVFFQLKEAGVGIEELEYLNENIICEIFPAYNQIGIKAKFIAKWKEWKKTESSVQDNTFVETIAPDIFHWIKDPTNSTTSTCSDENCYHFEVDIDKILSQTVQGASVLEYFEKNKNLDPHHQQQLTNCIVDSLIAKYGKLGVADLKRIGEKIIQRFPGEDINTYYISRGKNQPHPRGKLHDRYFNVRNRTNKTKALNSNNKKNYFVQENKPAEKEVDEILSNKIKSMIM